MPECFEKNICFGVEKKFIDLTEKKNQQILRITVLIVWLIIFTYYMLPVVLT